MMAAKVLLDTNIVSLYMRNEQSIVRNVETYLETHGQLSFSIITRYEILPGLKAKGASTRLRAFNTLCEVNEVLSLTDDIVVQAADVYASLYKGGELIGDADTLIAATAIAHGLNPITNNERHFSRVGGLTTDNWLR